MLRIAFILQIIVGLIVGPNGCCCTVHRIAGLFHRGGDAHTGSCCSVDPAEPQDIESCCSLGCCETEDDVRQNAPRLLPSSDFCCSQPNSCLCVAAIRPSIHRLSLDIDLSRTLTDHGPLVEWRATELGNTLVLKGTSHRIGFCALDQPGRACAVAYQRWNC